MSGENSFRESAEFFTERARRISSKVTALSRRDDLSEEEEKSLQETIQLADVYSKLGISYGVLALLDRFDEKKDDAAPE